MLEAPVSDLFPELFAIPRPITTPDVPVMVAASLLTAYDTPMLPIVKAGTAPGVKKDGLVLYRAIGSFPIIRLLVESNPKDHYKVLWGACTTTSIFIGSVEFEDPLERVLQVYEKTGFADARVDGNGGPPALITLDEVVSLYRERKLRCAVPASEVASRVAAVPPSLPLIDAMRVMCERRVRRLFLQGKRGEFVSDRQILSHLFSPAGLKLVRDSPGAWGGMKISDVPSRKAQVVSPTAALEDLGRLLQPGRDVFTFADGSSVLTKWDLVIKPWKAGRLVSIA